MARGRGRGRGLVGLVLTLAGLVALAGLAEGAKINTPRVLLPWPGAGLERARLNFTFEISEGGCYTWSLSRDDVITLEPLYENSWGGHCSRAARVTPHSACSPPSSVIILAEDLNTGEIIRGDVDIDKISSLKIVSTTWNLYLEEAPEAFEVEAFDDQGNKFSSLEGLEFTWNIENAADKIDEEPVVKLVWWRDTDYEAPRSVAELESKGRRGYSALLYGQTMGEARVIACLNQTCADVTLRVVASVVLTPATAIVAPGDTIRYRVVRIKAGRLTVENVADTLYRLELLHDGIANLDDGISLVRGKVIGSTIVSLMSGSSEVATSTLVISEPHSIRVVIRPPGLLVVGEKFLVQAIVLDKDGRALTAGDEMLVRLTVDGEADVKLLRSTENGTLTDAKAMQVGDLTVVAQLYSVAGRTLSKKVQGRAEATVVEPLEIIPSELYIAWTDSLVEVQLHHRGGGDGPVVWSAPGEGQGVTGEERGISVDTHGALKATSSGSAGVRVQLASYAHVRTDGQVWVLGAEYLRVASSGHARVGRPHALHVALTGTHPATGKLFTFHKCDCSAFAVTLLEGPEPVQVTAAPTVEPLEGACCVLEAVWHERGACALRISRGNIGDTARVFVRAAPQLIWPQEVAMLLGSTLPVLAAGEAVTAKSSNPMISEITLRSGSPPHAHPDLQLFTLTCRRKGETTIDMASISDEDVEEIGAVLRVACCSAVSEIRVDTPAGNCTGAHLWVTAGGQAALRVTLLDAVGRELLHEAGHKMSWVMSPKHSALEFRSHDRLLVETHPEYEPVPVPIGYYQVFLAGVGSAGWSGTLKATAGDVSAKIHARVVAPLHVEPQHVSLAWESGLSSNVAVISGGSGRYAVDAQKGAAELEGAQLRASWPAPGEYQLVVSDTCLADEVVNVQVRVEEVITVEVSTARAVCVGACVAVAAVARGASGRALRTTAPAQWRVSGVELREGQLCGVAEGTGRIRAALAGVWSGDAEVTVFPPLRVHPERVRVPPGARLQLTHIGGPPRHLATLTYAASHAGNTVEVSSSGLVVGSRIGTARVVLTARDISGADIAHAEAEIEVVGITGVRAVAATRTLLVGEEAPLWLEADPSLTPAVLASLQPAPKVTWTLRDPVAATLATPLLAKQSSERGAAEGLSVRLTPLRPGPVTVDVRVKMHLTQGGELRSWDMTVEILAIQELQASVEGLQQPINSQLVSVALGATVQLRASPRAAWRAISGEESFALSPAGEVNALKCGFGVAIAKYRDERNGYERETVVHIEVSSPHYVTTQLSGQSDDLALRVEARSVLGRKLLTTNMTLAADAQKTRVSFQSRAVDKIIGSELLINGLDSEGAFVTVQGTVGDTVLRDYAWVEGTDVTAQRIGACSGWAICLEGGGWRGSPALWLGEHGGVTLAVLQKETAGRHVLKADRPSRSVTIVQSPLNKMEFLAGEWPAALVPLTLEASGLTHGPVLCTEQQRTALADMQPVLPYLCQVEPPYTASAVFDTYTGQMGCSVTSKAAVTHATEVQVCAVWGAVHTCTQVTLLPPVRFTPSQLSLTKGLTRLTVHGHPHALKSVTVTGSPGLELVTKKTTEGELTVDVSGPSKECGNSWITIRSRLTAQVSRVVVENECEVTCGSLLGAVFSLMRPYLPSLSTLVTIAVMCWAAAYLYYRLSVRWESGQMRFSARSNAEPSVLPPRASTPTQPRTWAQSPYAVRQRQGSPVYGDASLLSENSFSPNLSGNHSSFL